MTLRRLTQAAAVAGVLISAGLFATDAAPGPSRSIVDQLVGLAFGLAIVSAPFVVAFLLLNRQPVHQRRCLILLVAIVAAIVVAFLVRPDKTSPNGADGLQFLAASFYQAVLIGAAAAVSDFATAGRAA